MTWDDFYDRYSDWTESTLKTRISSLKDVGNGEDVVDVCQDILDEKIKIQLIRKSMKLGVKFTYDDFLNLDGEIPDALFEEIAAYSGFSASAPYFDEHNFDWDDFKNECTELPDDMVLRCIPRIKNFGSSDEVVDVILSLSTPADDDLYERALEYGVKFSQEQIKLMGREDIFFVDSLKKLGNISDKQIDNFAQQVKAKEKEVDEHLKNVKTSNGQKLRNKKASVLGTVIGIINGIFGNSKD